MRNGGFWHCSLVQVAHCSCGATCAIHPFIQSHAAIHAHTFMPFADNWNCSRCHWLPAQMLGLVEVGNETGIFEGLQAVVIRTLDTPSIFVGFRGTSASSISDWTVDLDITKDYANKYLNISSKCSSKAKGHKGFLKAYTKMMDNGLRAILSDAIIQYPSYPVVVTGHSLGAALALITAMEVAANHTNAGLPQLPPQVITFGQPRVGDAEFAACAADMLPLNATRVTHHHDLIPMLPFEWMGFHHASREVWLKNENDTLGQASKAHVITSRCLGFSKMVLQSSKNRQKWCPTIAI